MAGRIAGITVEIGGDTTDLQKSLKGVDSQLKTTQSNLKDINKLLKLDPGNTELLKQKQKELESAIAGTKDRLQQLKAAQSNVAEGTPEWDKLQREIIETEQNLQKLEGEYKEFGSVAKQQLQAVGAKLQESGEKIQDFGNKLAPVSAAAAAIGGALLKMGYDAVTSADDLNTLSKQTGVSTEMLQKMSYASDLVDVSVSDITGAMKKLKTKIDPSNEALKSLGVSATDVDGNLRDTTDVFFDVIEALSKIENETEKDQIAMELFGKSADSLAGIIDDGGAALKEYGAQAEELGLILDQDTLDSLNATNDEIDKMKATIKGTMAVVGSKVVPVLAPIITKIGDFVVMISEKLGQLNEEQTKTILTIVGVVAAAAPAIIMIGKIVSGVGSLISSASSLLGVLGNPAVLIIAALVAAGILLYKNWDKIKAKADEIKKKVSEAWNSLKTSVTNVVNNLKTSVTTAWNNIKMSVTNVMTTIKTAMTTAWTNIKTTVSNTISNIKSAIDPLKTAISNLKTTWSDSWDNIKEKIESVSGTIKQTIDAIKEKFQPLIDKITNLIDKLKELTGTKATTSDSGTTKSASGAAVGNTSYGNNIVINVYASAGMDVNELTDKVQRKIIEATRQRGAVYA